jgi:hypothetical protein
MPELPSLMRTAHGAAAAGGAIIVVERTPLDELPKPPNAERTEQALALRSETGRPFEEGNSAASARGPALTRIPCDPDAPEEQRRVHRRAASLKAKRARELSVQYGFAPWSAPTRKKRPKGAPRAPRCAKIVRPLARADGPPSLSSAVLVELVAWARAAAWADFYDRAGDGVKAVALGEKASGHSLRAIGIAEREAAAIKRKPADYNELLTPHMPQAGDRQ